MFVIDISIRLIQHGEIQFSLVAQSCPTLCDPMECSRETDRVLEDESKEIAPSLLSLPSAYESYLQSPELLGSQRTIGNKNNIV